MTAIQGVQFYNSISVYSTDGHQQHYKHTMKLRRYMQGAGAQSERFPRGGRGGKNLGPKGDGVNFSTSLDAFLGHFLTILQYFLLWGLVQVGVPPPPSALLRGGAPLTMPLDICTLQNKIMWLISNIKNIQNDFRPKSVSIIG